MCKGMMSTQNNTLVSHSTH